jgi:hypothetical protein
MAAYRNKIVYLCRNRIGRLHCEFHALVPRLTSTILGASAYRIIILSTTFVAGVQPSTLTLEVTRAN